MRANVVNLALALREYGLGDKPAAEVRQARLLNVVALAAGGFSALFTILYVALGPISFAKMYVFNIGCCSGYLLIVELNRRSTTLTAIWGCIVVTFIQLIGTSVILGTAAGSHFYFLAVPLVLALLVSDGDRLTLWSASCAALLTFAVMHNSDVKGLVDELPSVVRQVLQTANGACTVLLTLFVAFHFRNVMRRAEARLQRANQLSDNLLLSIFPSSIAERLKRSRDVVIAERHDNVTVIFADIVGFTARTAHMPPDQLIGELDQVFRKCDELAANHDIEKIKTIGDAYFAIAGLTPPDPDHALRMVKFALALRDLSTLLDKGIWPDLRFRVAIHSGPVIAGVIGRSKYAYDAWGETVNIASRLEGLCQPNEILISPATKAMIGNEVLFASPRQLDIRDVGSLEVYPVMALAGPSIHERH